MAYGTLKVDNITYTSGGSDASTSVSGLVNGNFPNVTITGTISGATITGNTGQFTTITAVTGIFTTTLSGSTVTGGTAQFTTVTGGTAGFTTITGQTVTGALAEFTSGTVKDLVVTNSLVSPSGTNFSVAGSIVVGGSGFFGSGISVTGQISGQTITGTAAAFGTVTGTTVTGTTANFVTVSGTTVTGGSVNDSIGNVRNIPQNSQGSTYTLVASDAGKHIFAANTVTVPSGVFSVGQAVSIYNNTAGDITISGAPGITLRRAGTADTGNRTLAERGLATILCVSGSVDFVINGGGLS